MKITIKQLRRLILKEVRLKPSVPGATEDQYAKILDLSRSEDPAFRKQADSLADALGYDPVRYRDMYDEEEGEYLSHAGQKQSFSDELRDYDRLSISMKEVMYIMDRLQNSSIGSFVNVYENELERMFKKSYTLKELEIILDQLGSPWELKYDYQSQENYFQYDQQGA